MRGLFTPIFSSTNAPTLAPSSSSLERNISAVGFLESLGAALLFFCLLGCFIYCRCRDTIAPPANITPLNPHINRKEKSLTFFSGSGMKEKEVNMDHLNNMTY